MSNLPALSTFLSFDGIWDRGDSYGDGIAIIQVARAMTSVTVVRTLAVYRSPLFLTSLICFTKLCFFYY